MASLFVTPTFFDRGMFSPVTRIKREIEANRRFALEDALASKHVELDAGFLSVCVPYTVRLHLELVLRLRKVTGMAKPKALPAKQWNGFVACELTAEDKATFKVWDVDFGDAFDLLVGRVTEGYRLSVSHNKKNDSFIASLTGSEDNGDNAGYTLSAFGKDIATAMRVLAFKDGFILEGVWENAKVQAKDDIG